MTAAHDQRAIVNAQARLTTIAYATGNYKSLSRKEQKKRDQVIEAINQDTVVAEAVEIAERTYAVQQRAEALATTWEEAAKRKIVGEGIAASLLWALFWRWVFPLLLDWAQRWLLEQAKSQYSVVTHTATDHSSILPH